MAKKKRTAPQKACVKCGKMIHARKLTCDHCGAKQKAVKKAAKKKVVRKTARKKAAAASVGLGEVQSAAEFISSVGGVAQARQALSTAEQLAKKLS